MTLPLFLACLSLAYSAKQNQKGGTIIIEDVHDLETHQLRLADPDSYRPPKCPNCFSRKLHAHGFRERRIRGCKDISVVTIRRYLCVACKAAWQVLPTFVARCLHRTWQVVQSAMVSHGALRKSGHERRVDVPYITRWRWAARLRSSAKVLTQALAATGAQKIHDVLEALSIECNRAMLIEEFVHHKVIDAKHKLAQFAHNIHHAVPGLRLM